MQRPSSTPTTVNQYVWAIVACAVCLCSLPRLGYAQAQTLRQMDHAVWTARDGAPQSINRMAQAPDGTLWIGSDSGLYTFDGQEFRPFKSPAGQPELPTAQVFSLLVSKTGTLWVGFSDVGVARISASRVDLFSTADAESLVLVLHLQEAADGTIWAIGNQLNLIRFGDDGAWHREASPSSGRVGGIFIDSANTLWLAQAGTLYRRPLSQPAFTRTSVPALSPQSFDEVPNGHIFMNDYDIAASRPRLKEFTLDGALVRELPDSYMTNGRVIHAGGGVFLSNDSRGLFRFSLDDIARDPNRVWSAQDTFTTAHGLSSGNIQEVLADSYGSIWVGGVRGLERLRPSMLTLDFDRDPITSLLCGSPRGELWFGSLPGVYPNFGADRKWLRKPETTNVYAMACADGGYAWFVDNNGVWAVREGKVTPLPPIPGSVPFSIMNIAVGADRTVYATVRETAPPAAGVWQFRAGAWSRRRGDGDLGTPGAGVYVDQRDQLWIGHSNGHAVRHSPEGAQLMSSGAPGLGQIHVFLEVSRGMFAAGVNGFAVVHDGRLEMLTFAEPSLVRGVRGIVEAANGDMWLNAARGFVQVPVKELETALASPAYPIKARLITEGEFAGAPQLIRGGLGLAARDSKGGLWFVTRLGIVNLDPSRFTGASPSPVVTIQGMIADGRDVTAGREVEAGTRTLAIRYRGVNLTAPETVIFRYRLEPYDSAWQEAGRRSEAIYTRLPPGTYSFSVVASNGDGTWTQPVSAAPFTVSPSFYQTWWFAAAMVGLAMTAVAVIYQIRVRQLARVMNARFDARLAERTRVARDLHDTLLQTVHGSKLVADRALRDMADRERLVGALEQVSVWLAQAATEGRAALQSLRSSTKESSDLVAAIQRAIDECQHESEATMPFAVHGQTREVHPVVGDEIFRIGYEAIRNACHHARATRISVTLDYGQDLTLQISDDGVGIDAEVIDTGKDGHFGLRGMRERAERISAKLTAVSSAGTGTAITLTVPGQVAYRSA